MWKRARLHLISSRLNNAAEQIPAQVMAGSSERRLEVNNDRSVPRFVPRITKALNLRLTFRGDYRRKLPRYVKTNPFPRLREHFVANLNSVVVLAICYLSMSVEIPRRYLVSHAKHPAQTNTI